MRCQHALAFLMVRSRLYFVADPAHQVGVDARQEGIQRGAVERAVVLHPAAHDRVDPSGELGEGVPGPAVQPPRRTSPLIFFRASLLIAGRNEVNIVSVLARAARARNVNPRNVNAVCS